MWDSQGRFAFDVVDEPAKESARANEAGVLAILGLLVGLAGLQSLAPRRLKWGACSFSRFEQKEIVFMHLRLLPLALLLGLCGDGRGFDADG